MKTPIFFSLLLLIGCQNKPTNSEAIAELPVPQEIAMITNDDAADERALRTDTIYLSEDKDSPITHVLANLVDLKADQDSIMTSKFRLDFYQNKNKLISSKVVIKNYEKGSEWGGSIGLTNTSHKNSPFIQLGFGYPACGYVHENYLYYFKNSSLQLVHQWNTMSDSGWGNWLEIVNPSNASDPKSFYCKTVAFVPADDDENMDMGVLSHSDSIGFELKGNQWSKKLLSAKDKAYFQKKMTFDQFNSTE
ncbi:hypothetical protein [Flavobacterium phragmitis]|uniref:Uncharacterized protein n=1 Tax=Flavobacterium phragmitis TaxID=739143 RepID=A0A1I1JRL2_9FLAO|nr:hypothetical protein [Flavobacterium phragmitis]SFC51025.1 hypothetical protein SAMN05216297_10175 [Flavobacterium phragmitis]